MDQKLNQEFEKWLEGRPDKVKAMARRYPPGTVFSRGGKTWHLVSYTDAGGICVSEIDPSKDYEKAVETRREVCPCCMKDLLQ